MVSGDYSLLLLAGSHGQHLSTWVWLSANKTLFTTSGDRWDLTCRAWCADLGSRKSNGRGGNRKQKNRMICLSNSESRLDGRPEFEVNNTEVQKNGLVVMLKGSCKGHCQAKVQRWQREGRNAGDQGRGFGFWPLLGVLTPTWPKPPPTQEISGSLYTVLLQALCREGSTWGCLQKEHLEEFSQYHRACIEKMHLDLGSNNLLTGPCFRESCYFSRSLLFCFLFLIEAIF